MDIPLIIYKFFVLYVVKIEVFVGLMVVHEDKLLFRCDQSVNQIRQKNVEQHFFCLSCTFSG